MHIHGPTFSTHPWVAYGWMHPIAEAWLVGNGKSMEKLVTMPSL